MDRLAAVLEKLAEGDKLDKAIDVLESAASKPSPMASHHRWQKGWGYGAAAPPYFRVFHRILIFYNRNIVWSAN